MHSSRFAIATVFIDTWLWETKHLRKRFQNSVSLKCYRHIGSKSTNHSTLAWRRTGQNVTLVSVIGGFQSDLSISRKTDWNFGNVYASVLFFQSCVNKNVKWNLTSNTGSACAITRARGSWLKCLTSRSNWNLEMLVFEERGKPETPEKNLSEQSREPATNSTHI